MNDVLDVRRDQLVVERRPSFDRWKIAWPCAWVVSRRHLLRPGRVDAPVPVDARGGDTDRDEAEHERSEEQPPLMFSPSSSRDDGVVGTTRRRSAGLQPVDHVEAEGGRADAVDDAVVEGHRDVAHRRTTTWPSRTTGRSGDAVQPEDRDLGVVDERRHEEPAELAGARDREGRVAELLGGERPARAPSARRGRLRGDPRRESRSQPRTTGTTRPSSVWTATPTSTRSRSTISSPSSRALSSGNAAERPRPRGSRAGRAREVDAR